MIKSILGITTLLITLVSTQVNAAIIKVAMTEGHVSFLAIGKPSSLKVNGKGASPKGTLEIDKNTVSGTITFDLTSLTTGISLRDQHMKEKYLETAKFPESSLKIAKLELPNELTTSQNTTAKMAFTGDLTLKGVTKPISGELEVSKSNSSYDVKSEFKIVLSDYGVDIPKYMGITIAQDVTINVESKAETTK